jgi:hypothetical protein
MTDTLTTIDFQDSPEAGASTDSALSGEYSITHPILGDLDHLIGRYFVMSPAQRLVTATWIVHTHMTECAMQTPYLAITSPEKRCGKTYLLELLAMLVRNPFGPVIGPSEATVFRAAGSMPTMILDEYDTIFGPKTAQFHESLRMLLNAGTRPGATVPRCVPPKMNVVDFPVYCAKALGGIGHLPDTVADRSVIIMMRRKTKFETVERFRRARVLEAVEPIRANIVAWAQEYAETITGFEPEMPEELNDRMMDACEILVSIADAMGDGAAVRAAILEVVAEEPETHETTRLTVLRDLRTIYQQWPKANMPTRCLLPALHALSTEWSDYYGRGPLKDTDLASLLAYFGLKAKTVWIPAGVLKNPDGTDYPAHDAKGYKYAELADNFARYLPPEDADDATA